MMAIKDKYLIERRYITNRIARSGGRINKVLFLVSHETANNVADADAHFRYFNNVTFQTSAHSFVDHKKILEIIPLNEKAWHVQYQVPTDNVLFGDDANDAAIGIELCRTGDFNEAYDRYVWYHAYLCRTFGLKPREHIVSHEALDPRRRSDPESWLNPNGITWNRFILDVVKYYDNWEEETETEVSPAPEEEVQAEEIVWYLSRGNTGQDVRELQQKLNALGYSLAVDGSFGPATERAVRDFQRDQGLAVDGSYGPATQRALQNAKPSSGFNLPNTDYWVKSPQFSGAGVREVQEALASLNFYPDRGAPNNGIDGYYGPKTADAVRRFQLIHMGADEADGNYGPKTKRAMEREL
ncbi:N-acetylmuramoyl-L-alanine amidase [Oceanobacillus bengalensis]|uniref:peptidoglycan recognition protein family protein n=1 Tax=Oceanobacillus bengalensis TaxID=1435466 RepID=UPI0036442CD3